MVDTIIEYLRSFSSKIVSTGSYLPENIVTNDMLKQFPENARDLIELKTGVKARRFANPNECTSDLAIRAAINCLSKANFDPLEVDSIILVTSSPDRIQPPTATRVQYKIGAYNSFVFDLKSVCSGAVFGIAIADSLIKSGFCENVLLVASEVYSKILNPSDFYTYPYFGDGAAALLLQKTDREDSYIVSLLKSDGSGSDIIQIPAGGTMIPFKDRRSDADLYFKMKGKTVYTFAIEKGTEIINEVLEKYDISKKEEIKYVISHQANINIIKEIAKNTGINMEKFYTNFDKYGNTAAASVLIALDELFSNGKIEKGDIILIVAFGGGLNWGVNLIRV